MTKVEPSLQVSEQILKTRFLKKEVPSPVAQQIIIELFTIEDLKLFEGTIWGHYTVSESCVCESHGQRRLMEVLNP